MGWAKTIVIACLAWAFFRAASIGDAFEILSKAASFNYDWGSLRRMMEGIYGGQDGIYALRLSMTIFIFVEILLSSKGTNGIDVYLARIPRPATWALYVFLVVYVLLLGKYDQAAQFIYFQF